MRREAELASLNAVIGMTSDGLPLILLTHAVIRLSAFEKLVNAESEFQHVQSTSKSSVDRVKKYRRSI